MRELLPDARPGASRRATTTGLIFAECHINYRSPVHFDEEVAIELRDRRDPPLGVPDAVPDDGRRAARRRRLRLARRVRLRDPARPDPARQSPRGAGFRVLERCVRHAPHLARRPPARPVRAVRRPRPGRRGRGGGRARRRGGVPHRRRAVPARGGRGRGRRVRGLVDRPRPRPPARARRRRAARERALGRHAQLLQLDRRLGYTLSRSDSNQQLTLTQQLAIDIRSVELDVHWGSTAESSATAPSSTPGCTSEGTIGDGSTRSRPDAPENADQVLLLYLEDASDSDGDVTDALRARASARSSTAAHGRQVQPEAAAHAHPRPSPRSRRPGRRGQRRLRHAPGARWSSTGRATSTRSRARAATTTSRAAARTSPREVPEPR